MESRLIYLLYYCPIGFLNFLTIIPENILDQEHKIKKLIAKNIDEENDQTS